MLRRKELESHFEAREDKTSTSFIAELFPLYTLASEKSLRRFVLENVYYYVVQSELKRKCAIAVDTVSVKCVHNDIRIRG